VCYIEFNGEEVICSQSPQQTYIDCCKDVIYTGQAKDEICSYHWRWLIYLALTLDVSSPAFPFVLEQNDAYGSGNWELWLKAKFQTATQIFFGSSLQHKRYYNYVLWFQHTIPDIGCRSRRLWESKEDFRTTFEMWVASPSFCCMTNIKVNNTTCHDPLLSSIDRRGVVALNHTVVGKVNASQVL